MNDEAVEAEEVPDASGFIFGLKVTADAEVIKAADIEKEN